MPLLTSQVGQTSTGILFMIEKQKAKPLQLIRKAMKIFHFHKSSDKMSKHSIQNSKGNLRNKPNK